MDALSIWRQAHRLTVMYKITSNQIDINKQEYLHLANTSDEQNPSTTHIFHAPVMTGMDSHNTFYTQIKQTSAKLL